MLEVVLRGEHSVQLMLHHYVIGLAGCYLLVILISL